MALGDSEESFIAYGSAFCDCLPGGAVFIDLHDKGTYTLSAGDVFAQFHDVERPHLGQIHIQKERFLDLDEYERVKDVYTLNLSMLNNTRDNLRILHPLPRVNEIAPDVDQSPKAYYFQQAKNGLFVRQAIISKALGL
mgnify:CR=1 FL=1